MKILEDVDVDEVSPVRRAANRRKFVLKEDADVSREIDDIMQIAAPFEGAMLDGMRADGADETVQKAAVAAVRLLKGVEDELPEPLREMVSKLGSEMYPVRNMPLNTTTTEPNDPENELIGSDSAGGALPTWKADCSDMDDDDDDDDEDVAKAFAEKSAVSKRTFTADQRRDMASNGQAMTGGRYPIANRADLSNAIHAIGRGKGSHAAIRSHIISRAKALGATSMLPPAWKVGKAESDESLGRRVLEAVGLTKTQDEKTTPADENGDTSVPENDDVTKADQEGGTVESTEAVPVLKEDGTWDLDGVPEAERRMLEPIAKAQAETMAVLAETREALAKSQDALAEREFVRKAETELSALAAPSALGPVLKEAAEKLSPEANEQLESILKAANAQVETGDLFKELGRTALPDETGGGESPWAQIEKAASELVEKSDDGLTESQAIDRVLKTAAGQKLYARYQAEQYHMGAANLTGMRGEAV